MDKSGANKAAIDAINAGSKVPIAVRQVKYLNNIIEQDHRDQAGDQADAQLQIILLCRQCACRHRAHAHDGGVAHDVQQVLQRLIIACGTSEEISRSSTRRIRILAPESSGARAMREASIALAYGEPTLADTKAIVGRSNQSRARRQSDC